MKAKVTIQSLKSDDKLEFETDFDQWLVHGHIVQDSSDIGSPYVKHKSLGRTVVFCNVPGLLARIQDWLTAVDQCQSQFIDPTAKRHGPLQQ